jgi:hypothetical protein
VMRVAFTPEQVDGSQEDTDNICVYSVIFRVLPWPYGRD